MRFVVLEIRLLEAVVFDLGVVGLISVAVDIFLVDLAATVVGISGCMLLTSMFLTLFRAVVVGVGMTSCVSVTDRLGVSDLLLVVADTYGSSLIMLAMIESCIFSSIPSFLRLV